MREVFALAEQTKRETDGFFDIRMADGSIDPSGHRQRLGDPQCRRRSSRHAARAISSSMPAATSSRQAGTRREGVERRHSQPLQPAEIIKVIYPRGQGIATSGTYVRGQHIYNPHAPGRPIDDIVSLTVIGPDVLEADRFATAAFAMGKAGIVLHRRDAGSRRLPGRAERRATLTSGFGAYIPP